MTRSVTVWRKLCALTAGVCLLGGLGCETGSGGGPGGRGLVDTPGPDLTLQCTGQGSVTVTPPGDVYDAAALPVSIAYTSGDQVTIQATADAGWQFSGWQGVMTGTTNPATLTMLGDTTLTAVFTDVGGNDNEGANNPDFGSVETTIEQSLAAGQTVPEAAQAAADYLKTVDAVEDAGVAAGGKGAWAKLKDGGYEIVSFDGYAFEENTDPSEKRIAPPPRPDHATRTPKAQRSARNYPEDPMIFIKIRPAFWLGSYYAFYDYAREAGYTNAIKDPPGAVGDANVYGSIEWYKTLGQYSVIYLETDCLGWNFESLTAAPTYWALMTTDLYTPERQQELQADIRDGLVMPAIAITKVGIVSKTPTFEHRYFVSQSFLHKYCSTFKPGSLVYIDGCGTWEGLGPGGFDVAGVLTAVKQATSVVGWDIQPNPSGSFSAADKLFRLMFGINGEDAPTPPYRPWPFLDSFDALETWGLTSTGAVAALAPSADPLVPLVARLEHMGEGDEEREDETICVPSIRLLAVNALLKEMQVFGEFGGEEPTVKLGGKELSIIDQTKSMITVSVEPSDMGDVVVTNANDIQSNTVPLSQWSGTFTISGDYDPETGPHVEASVQARFRQDVHEWRNWPDTEPHSLMGGMETANSVGLISEPDGSFTVEFSGTFVDNEGCTWVWSGSDSGSLDVASLESATLVIGTLGVDHMANFGGTGFFEVILEGSSTTQELMAHWVTTCPGPPSPTTSSGDWDRGFRILGDISVEQFGGVTGGTGTDVTGPPSNHTLRLTIPSMQPENPPTDETPG